MNPSMYDSVDQQRLSDDDILAKTTDRRKFLQYAGLATITGSAFLASACSDKSNVVTPANHSGLRDAATVNLGSGDAGILNYAYALEQLEAAFYTMVCAHPQFTQTFSSAMERQMLTDIRDHEIVHREFFKAALGNGAIIDLMPNFSAINFASRSNVLFYAKTFEDLGVAAYNGAGKFIKSVDYLLLAGKIVSVEARHASAIRDLINPKSRDFAGDDVVDPNPAKGLDRSFIPSVVLPMVQPFVLDTITAQLP